VFAVVVRDRERKVVLAARDALGMHPLYQTSTREGWLAFSSDLGALTRHPSVATRVDRLVVADHLARRWPRREETFWEGVVRILPGHARTWGPVGSAAVRYWDPWPAGAPARWVPERELGRFDFLLEQAVLRALAAGDPGLFLSGGLDSVSVAGVAADLCRRRGSPPPLALSLAFPHPDCDESAAQARIARQLGMPQDLTPLEAMVGSGGLLAAALAQASRLAAPLQSPWMPAYRALAARGRARGVRVILTGSGGDEWLGVTPVLASDLLARGDLAGVLRLWGTLQRSYDLSWPHALRNLWWTSGLRPLLGRGARAAVRRLRPGILRRRKLNVLRAKTPPWLAPDPALQRALAERCQRAAEESFRAPPSPSAYWSDCRAPFEHPLMLLEAEENFAYARDVGVRLLHPFWDPDLVAFLFRVPPRLLNLGGRSKGLVRRTLDRRFPDLGFRRQKKVLASEYFRSSVREGTRARPSVDRRLSAMVEAGIIDGSLFPSLLDGWIREAEPWHLERVWDLLTMEAWIRGHISS
jgi:asparagine synthase (glutamine-hydrolysing)